MIYFITNRYDEYKKRFNPAIFKDIEVLTVPDGKHLYFTYAHRYRKAFIDVETNGLDPYRNKLLLTGIMFKRRHSKITFVFDNGFDINDVIENLTKHYVIGHNLKFDIKFAYTNSNKILIKNIYDTMLAENRLYMGSGLGFSLADLIERYLKEYVNKDTRDEFIGQNPNTFRVDPQHLYYLEGDLSRLPAIMDAQKSKIKKFKMEYLIYGIECPLCPIMANAELIGFHLNVDKWLARIREDIELKHEVLINLDRIVINLRDTLPINPINKQLLTGGKYEKKRTRSELFDKMNTNGTIDVPNLFGETSSAIDFLRKKSSKTIVKAIPKIPEYPGCVKYTKQQVIHIFGALEQPAITEDEVFSVPTFDKKGKCDFNRYSLDADVLERYLILKPDTPMKDFLEEFKKYQQLEKALTTYGKKFIDNINEVTGRIHTEFRQCMADTGRMQSGGGKKAPDKFNCQNVPAEKKYREPFEAGNDDDFDTQDYSGAELVIMASHAQDFDLIKLAEGDMHSAIATNVWRAIYKDRAYKYMILTQQAPKDSIAYQDYKQEYYTYRDKSYNFVVTKTDPPGFRTAMKPMGFGTIYGMYDAKAGKTLNIPKHEGGIAIKVIKNMLPKTIAFVEGVSASAEKYGYVIHNTRVNSRRWFPMLIKNIKGEISKQTHFIDISKEASEARNSSIQGTQADFVKEASVKLQHAYWRKGYDADILLWVHDEIGCRMHPSISAEASSMKQRIMKDVANLYLKNVKIDVEGHTLKHWTK